MRAYVGEWESLGPSEVVSLIKWDRGFSFLFVPRSFLHSIISSRARSSSLYINNKMSSDCSNPQLATKDGYPKDTEKVERQDSLSISSGIDILGLQALDRSLNLKMHIVNNVSPQAPPFIRSWDFGGM
jgi:hypothetical protein